MHKELITKFGRLLEVKRYALSTRKTYIGAISLFLQYFFKKDVLNITNDDVFLYLEHKIKDDNISFSTQKGIVGAIKLFYKHLYNKNIHIDYIYPDRSEYKLPNVLSTLDIKNILDSITNIKHKSILSLIYSAGLRISELVHLELKDIDSKRMMIRIRSSKGNRDREVILSENILKLLREYYKIYKPKKYIFPDLRISVS